MNKNGKMLKKYFSLRSVALYTFFAISILFVILLSNKQNEINLEIEGQKIATSCKNSSYYEQCYKEKLISLTKNYDLQIAINLLHLLEDLDPRVRSCHAIAHAITSTEVSKRPTEWLKILQKMDAETCSGGFYHGAIEGHMGTNSTFKLTGATIDEICQNKDLYREGSCIHIFGHLILVEKEGVLLDAIRICDQVTSDQSDQCYSGVFMESMTKENLQAHGMARQDNWDQDSLRQYEKICLSLKEKAAYGCWGELGHMYSAVYKDQAQIVYSSCQKAQIPELTYHCYNHAVAKMAITLSEQAKVNDLCNPVEKEVNIFKLCIGRVVSALKQSSAKFYDRGKQLCSSLTSSLSDFCFQALNNN